MGPGNTINRNRNINNIELSPGTLEERKKNVKGGGIKEDKIRCLNDTIQFSPGGLTVG